ncbi:MAG TPA: polysaccharide biosynthesis/export family protein [Candidatus Binataceae bacterium]|nr:polysaccharide biosynthesis/export family protein [Candidatus Binataceae bacterium]
MACLAGCASTADRGDHISAAAQKNVCPPAAMLAAQEVEKGNYIIRPGDQLQLDFYLNPEFNRDVTVRPDGAISLDLVGSIPAADKTPEQLAAALNQAYSRELRNPGVSVRLKASPSWRVYVQGQVAHAGAFSLQPGMTAMQAIADAGGFTDSAGPGQAVLIRRDACGNAQGMTVNLRAADGGGSGNNIEDVALMPSDVLVVPRSAIANVDLFVKQYFKDLIPIQPYLPIPM